MKYYPQLASSLNRAICPPLKEINVNEIEHTIDCDVEPFTPHKWKAEEHKKGGQFKWGAAQIDLYFTKLRMYPAGWTHVGDVHRELSDMPVLNACVLDYLLAHQHLIPDKWKHVTVNFWGTIYRLPDDCPCVRFLVWHRGSWGWGATRFDGGWWGGQDCVALRKGYLDWKSWFDLLL